MSSETKRVTESIEDFEILVCGLKIDWHTAKQIRKDPIRKDEALESALDTCAEVIKAACKIYQILSGQKSH